MKVEIFLTMAVFRLNWGVFVDLQGVRDTYQRSFARWVLRVSALST